MPKTFDTVPDPKVRAALPKAAVQDREARFIDKYLLDRDVKRAALAAGWSESFAKTRAHQLVAGTVCHHVSEEIKRRQALMVTKFEVTRERVVEEIRRIALANIEDFTRLEGEHRVIDLSNTPRRKLAAIAVLTYEETGQGETLTRRMRVKFHPKMEALERLAKHLGLYDGSAKTPKVVVVNENREQLNGTVEEQTRAYMKLING